MGKVPESYVGSIGKRSTGGLTDLVRQVVVAIVADKGLSRLHGSQCAEITAIDAAALAAFSSRVLAKPRRIFLGIVGLEDGCTARHGVVAEPPPTLGAARPVAALTRKIG